MTWKSYTTKMNKNYKFQTLQIPKSQEIKPKLKPQVGRASVKPGLGSIVPRAWDFGLLRWLLTAGGGLVGPGRPNPFATSTLL